MIILTSTVIGCLSISAFASLVWVPVGVTSSAVGLKICAITAGIKKYKSIIKENKNKNDKIALLQKTKWDTVEVLISKALIDSHISYVEFVSTNNVLREYYDMKEEIKIPHFCEIHYISMVNISRKNSERNGTGTIVSNDGKMWLNEKHVEERLSHKNLQENIELN